MELLTAKELPRIRSIEKSLFVPHHGILLIVLEKNPLNIYLWIALYILIYIAIGMELYYYPLLLVHFLMSPIHGALVNWYCHKLGYRNIDSDDDSRNTLPIDFALLGELYQNNHHQNGKRLNFARRWFEVDFTYLATRMLAFAGIVRLKNLSIKRNHGRIVSQWGL